MNAVGKMLVVLQLCMSLLFVCFAGVAYSLQNQWQQKANDATSQLNSLRQSSKSEASDHQTQMTEAKQAQQQAETERDTLRSQLESADDRAEKAEALAGNLRQERDKAVAETVRATAEAASRLAESRELRREISSLRSQAVAQLEDLRNKDNKLLDLTGTINSYRKTEADQLKENIRLMDLLRSHRIDPRSQPDGRIQPLVEKVDGRIADHLRNKSRTQEFVELTIGSDDGIVKDMVLHVARNDKYVCDILITEVRSDISFGIVIEKTRNGIVQRGDNVTTKL